MNVAVVGATGAVGRALVQALEDADLPLASLRLLASERSAGTDVEFQGGARLVETPTEDAYQGRDLAFFADNAGTIQALDLRTFRPAWAFEAGDDTDASVVLDVEGYKDRRDETLVAMAHRLAEKAAKTGKIITISPMPSTELSTTAYNFPPRTNRPSILILFKFPKPFCITGVQVAPSGMNSAKACVASRPPRWNSSIAARPSAFNCSRFLPALRSIPVIRSSSFPVV